MHEVSLADWYNPFSFVVHKIVFRFVSASLTEASGSKINLRSELYTAFFHILLTCRLYWLVSQLTRGNILSHCFYLLSTALCHLACYVPSTCACKLRDVSFQPLFCSFFWNCELKGEKAWADLKGSRSDCGHSWTFLLRCPFGNDWCRICMCICDDGFVCLFFFFSQYLSKLAKEGVLECEVAPHASDTCPADQMEILYFSPQGN